MTALYNDLRPKLFKQVWGQQAAVDALQSALQHKSAQCFLLSGPSGVGKTTLARIMVGKLKCQKQEIDGATYTGIDKMREVMESVYYQPFGDYAGQALIIDECHRISAQAWDSLLKATEEPPTGVYWFFCTTNPDKVPKTIHTRALHLQLKLLSRNLLADFVGDAAKRANIQLDPQIKKLIVAEAYGSPRQALVNLDACRGASDLARASQLLQVAQESDAVLQLCRTVAGYANRATAWASAMQLLDQLADESAEGLRIRIMHYMAVVVRKADSADKARALLERMEPFTYPYSQTDADALLLRSLGAALLN